MRLGQYSHDAHLRWYLARFDHLQRDAKSLSIKPEHRNTDHRCCWIFWTRSSIQANEICISPENEPKSKFLFGSISYRVASEMWTWSKTEQWARFHLSRSRHTRLSSGSQTDKRTCRYLPYQKALRIHSARMFFSFMKPPFKINVSQVTDWGFRRYRKLLVNMWHASRSGILSSLNPKRASVW